MSLGGRLFVEGLGSRLGGTPDRRRLDARRTSLQGRIRVGTGAGRGERWALGVQVRPFPSAMHAASRMDFELVQACGVYGASNSAPKIERLHARQRSCLQRTYRQMSRRTPWLLGPVQISFGHPWFRRGPRTQARSARPKRNSRSACEHLFLLHERRVVASGTTRHRRLELGWSRGFSDRTHARTRCPQPTTC